MSWKELLQKEEQIVYPWTGGRKIQVGPREWIIEGALPTEHGWYEFGLLVRKAWLKSKVDAPAFGFGRDHRRGFFVGNRLVEDDVVVDTDPSKIYDHSEEVFLIEDGLDRFQRINAARMYEGGPLIFHSIMMPIGSEAEVLDAFLNKQTSISHVKNVPPALEAAFRMEVYQRDERERLRAELIRLREIEEQKRLAAERIGTGVGRRLLAAVDFAEAARSALAVGNAEYLDHRKSTQPGEMVVRFRLENRRFECTCDKDTLRIIDSGICLTDYVTRVKGDTWLTLESLPSVITEAIQTRKLHVYRHVDYDYNEDFDD